MMKEALYYKRLKGNKVNCYLCPHNCSIIDSGRGFCGVRENNKGKLFSLVYSKASSCAVDPIEKKPLYHFLPGHKSLSIATVGCNLKCMHCQNWEISQPKEIYGEEIRPERIVELAIEGGCKSISYTYTEPTIFYEYMLDIAKLAKKKSIKNVIVSNGYINEEPLLRLSKYIDAANIDLKGFNDGFYKKICKGRLNPVLDSLKILKEKDIWLEITNLMIPTLNDNIGEITKMCKWVVANLGKDVPLHFSAFVPHYRLTNLHSTSKASLLKARKVAIDSGLSYVYIGNLMTDKGNNTYCPKCKRLVMGRDFFRVLGNAIKDSRCVCGEEIAGVF